MIDMIVNHNPPSVTPLSHREVQLTLHASGLPWLIRGVWRLLYSRSREYELYGDQVIGPLKEDFTPGDRRWVYEGAHGRKIIVQGVQSFSSAELHLRGRACRGVRVHRGQRSGGRAGKRVCGKRWRIRRQHGVH